MAKFTAQVPLKMRLPGGFEIDGAIGATHRIPDALVEEFTRDVVPAIPGGVEWITQDETSAIPSLPISQANVSGLTTDLGNKYDKAGGTISGAATVTGALAVGGAATLSAALTVLGAAAMSSTLGVTGDATVGGIVLNGGSFVNPYDTDVWIAPANRSNPGNLSQAIYAQLRITGNAGAQVHDGAAIEIRLNGISNATFLNAIESSIVITGGSNTIPNVRAITGNMIFEGSPTGTVTDAIMLAAQNIAAPGSVTITNAYGVYVDQQTRATNNWSVYAPGGNSLFGQVRIEQSAGAVSDLQYGSGSNLRWIIRKNSTAESGSNAGSNLEILARSDDGSAVGTALTITRSNLGIQLGTGPLGFYGATPATKPTVSGSRGGNAALTDLLAELATLGLIVNSSTS